MPNKTSSSDDEDRQQFLTVRSRVVPRFHLLVETPESNLSKAMPPLTGSYMQAFNHCHWPRDFSIATVFVTTPPVLSFLAKLF